MEINSLSSTKRGNEVLRDVCVAILTLISGHCNSWFVHLFLALDRDFGTGTVSHPSWDPRAYLMPGQISCSGTVC